MWGHLSGAIRDLASAHIERLRNQPGWRKRAEDGLGTAAYVERLIVPHHELSPFNSLGSIDASVESVADALLNASGIEQDQKRGRAWRWASIAEKQLEDTGEPYLRAVAGSACRLAEGSFATQPPPDEPPEGGESGA